MKTKSTNVLIIRIILFILLCLYSFLVFAQTEPTTTNGLITASNLRQFTGIASEEKTSLEFSLIAENKVSTVILEKGETKESFKACAEFWVNFDGNKETKFQFSDKKKSKGGVYYRLKIIDAAGQIQYSNILSFKAGEKNPDAIASLVSAKN